MRQLSVIIALAVTANLGFGQSPVVLNASSYAYCGAATSGDVVRASNGDLYAVSIDESTPGTRTIVVDRSTDGGLTWTPFLTSGINDPSTGETGQYPTNGVSLAIDSNDGLHFYWWSNYYPSNYLTYYRNWNAATGFSPTVDIKAQLGGIPVTVRNSGQAIAIDQNDVVWLAAPSAQLWREQLVRSNQPFAAGGTFTSAGFFSTSFSAQATRIAVDALGRIQCCYYRNSGTGDFMHREYDPATGSWSAETHLGNQMAPNDYWGVLTCDGLGNTHLVACVDALSSSSTPLSPTLIYYRRDASGVMQPGVTIAAYSGAQTLGSNRYFLALGCDEQTGTCRLAYRDFASGGALVLATKGLTDATFTPQSTIEPPNAGANYYYAPQIRGTLYPASNGGSFGAHVTYRRGTTSPFDHVFWTDQASPPATVSFVPQPVLTPGAATLVQFSAPASPGELYIPVISCSFGATPLAPYSNLVLPLNNQDDCFLWYFTDPAALFIFVLGAPQSYFGTLDASGAASGVVAIPTWVPSGLGLPVLFAFITVNPTTNAVTGVSQVAIATLN